VQYWSAIVYNAEVAVKFSELPCIQNYPDLPYLGRCFKDWVKILPTTLQQCKELLLPMHLLLIEVIVLLPESPVLLLQLAVVVITHLHLIL